MPEASLVWSFLIAQTNIETYAALYTLIYRSRPTFNTADTCHMLHSALVTVGYRSRHSPTANHVWRPRSNSTWINYRIGYVAVANGRNHHLCEGESIAIRDLSDWRCKVSCTVVAAAPLWRQRKVDPYSLWRVTLGLFIIYIISPLT